MRLLCCALLSVALMVPTGRGLAAPIEAVAGYRVEFGRIEDKRLAELVEAVSVLKARADRAPPSAAGLRRRIAEDRQRIDEVLRSEGYYQGRSEAAVEGNGADTVVRVEVSPGPRFRIGRFDARLTEGDPELLRAAEGKLPESGKPARAPDIVAAEARLIGRLAERGHPFAKVAERRVVVDHATERVDVELAVDPGPPAFFGPVALQGLDDVRAKYVARQIAWKEGEPYDQRKVDQTRRALVRTGLFDSVRIDQPAPVAAGERLPMALTLAEADQRSIGASAEYATDVGIGGTVYWEHRNLFGSAEKLNLTAEASEQRYALRSQFGKPGFPTRRDSLAVTSEIKDERLDAYDSRGVSTTAGVIRDFGGGITGSLGLGSEYTEIKDSAGRDKFLLLSLPAQLNYDTTDTPLDPSRGLRVSLGYTPFFDAIGAAGAFHRLQASLATYFPVIAENKRLILAARAAVGTLYGAAIADIPASTRFYAGGGTLRGYAYQLAGPLDADRDPVGGRSKVEASLEARIRVTDDFGVVPFIDAGNAYRTSLPDPGDDIRVAAGIGFRYFASFGPLRADIAFPLNRRKGIDDRFQFYIGLGQAF